MSETVIETMVKPICRAPSSAASQRLHPVFDEAGDVLGDDDGVVDDEAGRDRQRHQRQVVDAVVEQVHDAEGPDQRQRHGDAGDGGGPGAAQEDEHHGGHQEDAQDQRPLHVADRGADGGGAIDGDIQVDGRRDRLLEVGERLLDALDGGEDVRPGLAADDHEDAALAVDPAGQPVVLDVVEDVGHVAQADGRAVLGGDDQLAIGLGAQQLIGRRDVVGDVGAGQRSLRLVGGRGGQRGAHVLQGHPVAGQRLLIDLHAHGRLLAPADEHLTDARDLRDLLGQNAVGGVEHLGQLQRLRGEREDQDRRVGRVDLAVVGEARQVGRQLGERSVDGRLDVARGAGDVAIEIELQRDRGRARAC